LKQWPYFRRHCPVKFRTQHSGHLNGSNIDLTQVFAHSAHSDIQHMLPWVMQFLHVVMLPLLHIFTASAVHLDAIQAAHLDPTMGLLMLK